REAITNLARHSRADRCRITLVREPKEIVLSVHDNGVQTESQRQSAFENAGHGLIGMRERLEELGGRLIVDPSDGWRIAAHLPAPRLQTEPRTSRSQPMPSRIPSRPVPS
ncbi:MAG: ATP-binding protein, partial [Acidobacteriota bacterium]